MTRNELINAFADANTRPAIVAWLKAADAYSGHSRDGMANLRDHMSTVQAALVKAAKADAKKAKGPKAKATKKAKAKAPKAKAKASKAKARRAPATPATVRKYFRNPTVRSIERMRQAIAAVAPDENGVLTLDARTLAENGIGVSWARRSNANLTDSRYMWCKLLTALGYAGRASGGTLTLTPIATDTKEVAA
jgi:hypothetical protein